MGEIAKEVLPVNIEDEHFFSLIDQLLGGNGDVVKEAEAPALIPLGVMARWPAQRVGVVDLTTQHGPDGGADAPGRAARRDPGERIELPRAERNDARDVGPVPSRRCPRTRHLRDL